LKKCSLKCPSWRCWLPCILQVPDHRRAPGKRLTATAENQLRPSFFFLALASFQAVSLTEYQDSSLHKSSRIMLQAPSSSSLVKTGASLFWLRRCAVAARTPSYFSSSGYHDSTHDSFHSSGFNVTPGSA